MDPNSSSFIRFQCILRESQVLFWESRNFYKLKTGDPILQKVSIIWSPLLYFNFKSFMDKNSLSFIRFQCILHDSGVLFGVTLNFFKLKRGNLISGGTQFYGKSKFFCPPLLYFNFKSFMDPISWSFIRFQCILDDSGVPSSESSNV